MRAREVPKKSATLENIVNKLNCKNFGQCYGVIPESFAGNKWITMGKTLIIGYDVMEGEIEAFRVGMRRYAKTTKGIENYSPRIVCIIACKRHNKRFALDNGRMLENCLPLTVIDKDITRPDTTEFFMQSHKIIKGTGKLPAYSMPLNEANLTMDEAQSLMMALCVELVAWISYRKTVMEVLIGIV
ncbi:unnamed protein product [Gongylonema pulchrum]|uniref:Piwi domain-containing protein n=1 Tax=Gongylonema pulchrum TaxID=637853 RepID=A0A183ERV6_9BILA|nr:unnamed protein product [Gongylonema pulchrum]